MKDYKRKLDYRLGLALLLSLACTTAILFVYGLYYENVDGPLLEYIDRLKEFTRDGSSQLDKPGAVDTGRLTRVNDMQATTNASQG